MPHGYLLRWRTKRQRTDQLDKDQHRRYLSEGMSAEYAASQKPHPRSDGL